MQPQGLEKCPSVLTPSSRDVDFQKWHVRRQHSKQPPLGRTPTHKLESVRKLEKLNKSDGFKTEKNRSKPVSKVDTNTPWASQTLPADMWGQFACHRKFQKPRTVANEGLENEWLKGVFQKLPAVGRHRSSTAPLQRLKAAASAPEIFVDTTRANHRSASLAAPRQRQLSGGTRKASVAESNVSGVSGAGAGGGDREVLNSRSSVTSEPEMAMTAEKSVVPKRTVQLSGLSLSKGKERPCVAADLAHKWNLPLSTVLESRELFQKYAKLPPQYDQKDSNEMLKHGVLHVEAMMQLAIYLADKSSGAGENEEPDFCMTAKEIMGVIDKNLDGTVDFHEFTCWYHERAFLEYVNLTKSEIHVRRIGQCLGISVADMDLYKIAFDRYDLDGSGVIDIHEFRELMHCLMKIPHSLRIPESRILHFWQDADVDGSKYIDLQEFVTFYSKHFESDAPNPMEDYYKAIRRVHGHG